MKFETIHSALANIFPDNAVERVAIWHAEQTVTYRQLDVAANIVATKLQAAGAGKGAHIGVLSANRISVIVAALAILKAGGVFVPLDSTYPVPRLQKLAGIAELTYIIAETALLTDLVDGWVAEGIVPVYLQPEISWQTCGENTSFIPPVMLPDDPIYIYFTSGTTGEPKAVRGRNSGLMHFIDWEIGCLGITRETRVSQLTSPSHDPYLRDVFTTLVAGGTICVPNDTHVVLSPAAFRNWLNESQVHVLHCTPTVFRNLCNGQLAETDFPALRYIVLAGEPLFGKNLKKWYSLIGDRVRIINLYGPTETTLAKLFYLVNPADAEKHAIPIGRPMNDTVIYILNEQLQPCASGEAGALYIGTRYRSLGYYKNPELNQVSFIPDPFAPAENDTLYATGDFVTALPDQNIVFLERKDRKVKVLGKQVQLGEVEKYLLNVPGIESCTVQHLKSPADDDADTLVAYYLSNTELAKKELNEALAANLPGYMIPKYFIRMESFPVNVNGKIDVSSLPLPESPATDSGETESGTGAATEAGNDNNGPGNEMEEKILAIWREVLNNEQIGVNDPFMLSGGDSLGIMLLIARVQSEFGYEITLWQIFDDLTVAKTCQYIQEAG